VLHEIVSAACQVTDGLKLNNMIQHDEYDVDEDVGEEFVAIGMIASKMVECDGRIIKGEEKRDGIMARTIVFCKRSCGKCAK